MNAQVVYELLEYFKKNSKYKERSIRLLKFLYNDVYRDISLKIEEGEKEELEAYASYWEDFQLGLTDFIDEDKNSILYYFKEMIDDNKEDFIDYFFDKINTYFMIVDNRLFREEDFVYYTCVFNIYLMCFTYHKNKDDFEKYKKYLDDFSLLIAPNGLTEGEFDSDYAFFLSIKKDIIDKIFNIDNFEEIPLLKSKFDECLKDICKTSYDDSELEVFKEELDFVERIIVDMRELKEKDHEFNHEHVFKNLENWVDLLSDDEEYFYTSILLYGDRIEYIRDCFYTYLEHGSYMDQVIEYIGSYNNKMFRYLDSVYKDGKDSFVTCMDMVFDSDSLEELENKLIALKEVSEMFDSDNISYQDVLQRVKDLSSDKFKKIYNGRKVMYMCSTANKTGSTDILERMIEVYSQMFEVSEDEIRYNIVDHFSDTDTMREFEDDVNTSLEELEEELAQKRKESMAKVVGDILEEHHLNSNSNGIDGETFDGSSNGVVDTSEEVKTIPKSLRKLFGRK